MRYRSLGRTGLQVSEVSFGAGPVSGLMTAASFEEQRLVLSRAVELGVNWIDTAAGYGSGRSEESLGRVLQAVPRAQPLHVATKVRLGLRGEDDLRPLVLDSVRASLRRLKLPRVTLLQLHNAVTRCRNDEPTSITPDDVLGPHGVLAALEELRAAGMVEHFGLTGTGHPDCLRTVIRCGCFATIQIPFHLLNPSALHAIPLGSRDTNYGQLIGDASARGMGVFAIRVYAAGALLDAPPSAHTLQTPFFPLALYERDRELAAKLRQLLGVRWPMDELALRFALSPVEISSAILGFGAVTHIDAAVESAAKGALPAELCDQILAVLSQGPLS